MTSHDKRQFRKVVYASPARMFPWRPPSLRVRSDGVLHPYRVLVSEIMLQQTQAARVVPYFKAFVAVYPSIYALARAPLSDVLVRWSGLGYNRRAQRLHECARQIVQQHHGRVPREREQLMRLSGVGPYTAGAVRAFAYNVPDVFLETNIRTVYLHHFFSDFDTIPDSDILPLVEETLDMSAPRAWYTALMDYGAHLKQAGIAVNKKSLHYKTQSPFEGSFRQLRGAVIRSLTKGAQTARSLSHAQGISSEHMMNVLKTLCAEGLIERNGNRWSLPR